MSKKVLKGKDTGKGVPKKSDVETKPQKMKLKTAKRHLTYLI